MQSMHRNESRSPSDSATRKVQSVTKQVVTSPMPFGAEDGPTLKSGTSVPGVGRSEAPRAEAGEAMPRA